MLPNDQKGGLVGQYFGSSYIFQAILKKFHLCSSLIAAFCTSQVLCSLWKMNRSKSFIVFDAKDDDVLA